MRRRLQKGSRWSAASRRWNAFSLHNISQIPGTGANPRSVPGSSPRPVRTRLSPRRLRDSMRLCPAKSSSSCRPLPTLRTRGGWLGRYRRGPWEPLLRPGSSRRQHGWPPDADPRSRVWACSGPHPQGAYRAGPPWNSRSPVEGSWRSVGEEELSPEFSKSKTQRSPYSVPGQSFPSQKSRLTTSIAAEGSPKGL